MVYRRRVQPAFTLLELMIAVGILGTGLIMVAAVFPVALSQHRDVSDSFIGQRLATKAAGIVYSRLQSQTLFIPPPNDMNGAIFQDEPRPVTWFSVPAEILPVGSLGTTAWYGASSTGQLGGIANALRLFNRMAGFPIPISTDPEWPLPLGTTNSLLISRSDMFFGAPPESDVTRESESRYVWYAFYSTGQ